VADREVDWPDYLAGFHADRPGVVEDVLSRALRADHSPYRWLARAVSADARVVVDLASGSGPVARELARPGRTVVGVDLSAAELGLAQKRGAGPLVQADARVLPFRDGSVDVVTSALGLVVVQPLAAVLAEVARVLRPGGRWVFSITHPIRWAFPDDPGTGGLKVTRSYFDRTPYVETGRDGEVSYAEHHRTLGDRIRALVAAGFILLDLVEPEWPAGFEQSWGAWSPLRGRLLPGTAIFVCELRP
jgi:SAM-dependent methyltransferase